MKMEDHLQKVKTDFQIKEGLLIYRNQRQIMVSCPWFTAVQTELENTLGDMGAASLITGAARTWGTKMVEMYKPQVSGMSFEEKVKYILQTFSIAGWGLAEVVEFSTSPPRIVIKKTEPYFEDMYNGAADGSRCYLYLGVMAIIEGFAKTENLPELETTETKCIAKGDPHCEFVLEPK